MFGSKVYSTITNFFGMWGRVWEVIDKHSTFLGLKVYLLVNYFTFSECLLLKQIFFIELITFCFTGM